MQMAPSVQTPKSRINVDVSTPAGSRVKVDVDETAATPVPTPQPVPAPAPPVVQPQPPAPLVQAPSAPMPVPPPPPPPVEPPQVQTPPAPQAPYIPQSAIPQPKKVVNVLSGNSLSINILSSVSGGYGSGVAFNGNGWYAPGSWRPGYMAWVCEDRPQGRVCFERWIQ